MLWFMVSDTFRSPRFLTDGVCIAFFHSTYCFGTVSETRRGECQVHSAMFDLGVLSRSNFLSQAGLLSPYDFQTLSCVSSLYAVHTLVISNLSLKRLHASFKVSEMIGTQVSWFLVHVLTVLHIFACIWPQNSTDLLPKHAHYQKLTLRIIPTKRLKNHVTDKYQGWRGKKTKKTSSVSITWLRICHSFHKNQSYWSLTGDVTETESQQEVSAIL